jgi:GNAT superfamily N-acetyltransferase
MKILTYRELDSKDGLVPLLDHAFNWTFNQKLFDRGVKIDPRLKDSPVSFCALEDERIVGHVGVLDLLTRTVKGTVEPAGGIFGVATLPSYTSRGIATALMERAHEHFREEGYRFSLLGTRRVSTAHEWYKKLGYQHLTDCESAYKILKNPSKPASAPNTGGIGIGEMTRIMSEFSKDRTGLVIRDEPYVKDLLRVSQIRPNQCIINREGYAIFREEGKSSMSIRELIALNDSQAGRLIATLEQRSKSIVCDRVILDKRLVKAYASRGYMISGNHGVVMAKPLSADSFVKETYGSDFFMSGLDGL